MLVKTFSTGSSRQWGAVVVEAAVGVVVGAWETTIEVGLEAGARPQAATTNAIPIVLWAGR
ncbi:MAG TPA: hypothetical protein VJQ57_12195 [Acidimicrobiia bacterium]|nr:hypothetical protein [Acidimicrobiia bacterium]